MYNGPPASPAAPACLSPFIFLHKANSHPLINAAASLGTFSSLYLFFCPEMPEASSCSAQNSADLSAALSPGSSYLISFCTSLAPWLSAFLLSRFLSQAHCVADCVFPSENLVSTFFLVWTPSHCLFLPPPPQAFHGGWSGGRVGKWERLLPGDFSFVEEPTEDLENSAIPVHFALSLPGQSVPSCLFRLHTE